MIGLEELIEDQAALSGQPQTILREMLGEHAHDLLRVFFVVAAFIDD